MNKVVISFRTPEGEEAFFERVEILEELGIDPDDVSYDGDGLVRIRVRFENSAQDEVVEDLAEEIQDILPDMSLIDYEEV